MFTNLSKEKRDGLLSKIVTICAYIAAAPRNKNTSNLLTYLSDLEQDVNVKKYGLVFKEHQEAIDTVLAEHTPVLTEERSLLIDNGGGMNFQLEGDNLAALQLLEKTHRGRIGLIYIDPPYNTGNKDFIYDDIVGVEPETHDAKEGRPREDRETKKRVTLSFLSKLYGDIQKIAYVQRRNVIEIVADQLEKFRNQHMEMFAEYERLKRDGGAE